MLTPCQSARKRDPDSASNRNPYQRLRRSSPESMEGTRARRAVPSRATERRAWGGAVGPRGRSRHGGSCSGTFGGDEAAAQGRTLELDAMGAMDEAVEEGGQSPRSRRFTRLSQ